jgi:hypothetical protein
LVCIMAKDKKYRTCYGEAVEFQDFFFNSCGGFIILNVTGDYVIDCAELFLRPGWNQSTVRSRKQFVHVQGEVGYMQKRRIYSFLNTFFP